MRKTGAAGLCVLAVVLVGTARAGEEDVAFSARGRRIDAIRFDGAALSHDFNTVALQLKVVGFRLKMLKLRAPRVPPMNGQLTACEVARKIADAHAMEVTYLAGREGAVIWPRASDEDRRTVPAGLKSNDWTKRKAAIWRAVGSGDYVLFMLAMAEFKTRGQGAVAIEVARAVVKNYFLNELLAIDEELCHALAKAGLTDTDLRARCAAAGRIGRLRTPEAMKLLVKALDDDSAAARRAVVRALGMCVAEGCVAAPPRSAGPARGRWPSA